MLRARVLTALALLAGFLVALFLFPPWAVALVFALVAALAGWEWAGLMRAAEPRRRLFALLVLGLCLLFATRPEDGFLVLWLLAAFFWLFFAPVWLRSGRLAVCPTIGILLLVPTWAALVALHGKSPWLLLAVMAIAWIADIGAYFSGRAFGRHKLAPKISPGKTWEGAAGGLLGVLLYGFLVKDVVPGVPPMSWPIFLVLLVVAVYLTILGDLLESLAKRQAEVKDSSHLLPGHGGILDRIDSQTSLLPLAALALRFAS